MLCLFSDSWNSLVVAIGSNNTTLKLDDVATTLLLEEVMQNNMEGSTLG